ncbi:MAG: hypothetical protein H6732_17480 [Alphaproteobacteria bacterium]|nr:hypothetical protein [Alphaproteobacteria bacterium]
MHGRTWVWGLAGLVGVGCAPEAEPDVVPGGDTATVVLGEGPLEGALLHPPGQRAWVLGDRAVEVRLCGDDATCLGVRGEVSATCAHLGDGLDARAEVELPTPGRLQHQLVTSSAPGLAAARARCADQLPALVDALLAASGATGLRAGELLALVEVEEDGVLVAPGEEGACAPLLDAVEALAEELALGSGAADVALAETVLPDVPRRLVPVVRRLGAVGQPAGGRSGVRGVAGWWLVAGALFDEDAACARVHAAGSGGGEAVAQRPARRAVNEVADRPVLWLPYPSWHEVRCVAGPGATNVPQTPATAHAVQFDSPYASGPSPVVAPLGGRVAYVTVGCLAGATDCAGGLGNHLQILHGDGLSSVLGLLAAVDVVDGDAVGRGEKVAEEGTATSRFGDRVLLSAHLGEGTDVSLPPSVPFLLETVPTGHWLVTALRSDEMVCDGTAAAAQRSATECLPARDDLAEAEKLTRWSPTARETCRVGDRELFSFEGAGGRFEARALPARWSAFQASCRVLDAAGVELPLGGAEGYTQELLDDGTMRCALSAASGARRYLELTTWVPGAYTVDYVLPNADLRPDLVLEALSCPTEVAVGDEIWCDVTIANTGVTATPATELRLSVGILGTAGATLGVCQTGALAVGKRTTVRCGGGFTATGAPGSIWFVRADADRLDAVREVSEANNDAQVRFTLIGPPTPAPDLQLDRLTCTASALPGGTVSCDVDVRNPGTAAAVPTTTRLLLSTNGTVDAVDRVVADCATPVLLAGAGVRLTCAGALPGNAAPGTGWNLVAWADAKERLDEVDEANNVAAVPFEVRPVPPPPADLGVETVTCPASVEAQQPLGCTVRVRNHGGSASPAVRGELWVSRSPTLRDVVHLLASGWVAALAPGEAVDLPWSGTLPPEVLPGSWTLLAAVDTEQQLVEPDEDDDLGWTAVEVLPKPRVVDLVVDALDCPARAAPGDAVGCVVTLRNLGPDEVGQTATTLHLSSDARVDAQDLLLGACAVPSLAGGASAKVPCGGQVPATTLPGVWQLVATADADDQVAETDEGRNTRASTLVLAKDAAPRLPDLRVAEVACALEVEVGEAFTCTVAVANTGVVATRATETAFLLTVSGQAPGTGVRVGACVTASVPAGAERSVPCRLVAPATARVGPAVLTVIVDAADTEEEVDETDNTADQPLVLLAPLWQGEPPGPGPGPASPGVDDPTLAEGLRGAGCACRSGTGGTAGGLAWLLLAVGAVRRRRTPWPRNARRVGAPPR